MLDTCEIDDDDEFDIILTGVEIRVPKDICKITKKLAFRVPTALL